MFKKSLTLILFFNLTTYNKNGSTVYICGPKGANKYHYSISCRGFSACKHEIVEVSKDKAKSFGLTLCGWEH
jgi:hypothetical protein